MHLSWVSFRASAVNQNTELSLEAACEGCGDLRDLMFSWELFLVNAMEDRRLAGEATGPLVAAKGSSGGEVAWGQYCVVGLPPCVQSAAGGVHPPCLHLSCWGGQ